MLSSPVPEAWLVPLIALNGTASHVTDFDVESNSDSGSTGMLHGYALRS